MLAFDNVNIIIIGSDYMNGPYTITLSAGSTTASFNVSIIDDSVLESEEEHFTLTINSSSLLSGVTAGTSNSSRITIMDDEGKQNYISRYGTAQMQLYTCL